jgi:hypothetical protein
MYRRAVLCLLALVASACTSLHTGDAVTGRYRLEGVREVGAALELKPEGRFVYALSYGAVDQYAEGRWSLDRGRLRLETDSKPASFTLGPLTDSVPGGYAEHPDKPVVMVVRVSTPRLGLVWSNMQVSAEFSNGKVRQGRTGDSGMLGFLKHSDPVWAGATVRRIGVAYPNGHVDTRWFTIDSSTARGVDIYFDPGELAAAAFHSASLEPQQDDRDALVVRDGDIGEPGWRFVRQ